MRRVVGVKSVGAALLGDVDVGVGGLDEVGWSSLRNFFSSADVDLFYVSHFLIYL